MAKVVMTVRGPISPDRLGVTMPHVHLLIHLWVGEQAALLPPIQTASDIEFGDRPVTMDILGKIRRNIWLSKDNKILGDIDVAISELMFYKRMGGSSLVEITTIGIGRDPVGSRQISEATGVNIICTSGWYINYTHPPFVKEATIKELCDYMVREVTVGIDNTGIKAGMIKACLSGATPDIPFTGAEENVLRAAAHAQAETGAALAIHPCHHHGKARHLHTYLDIMKKEGANLEKCYMCHMDLWSRDLDYQKSVLDRGIIGEFDQFGEEYYNRPGWYFPPDQWREESVVNLVQAGYVKQIVLSNENSFKSCLRKYGGYGYAHVLENIVPDLKFYGITEEQLNTMLVENPTRLLSF